MLRFSSIVPIVLLICPGKADGEIRYLDVPDVVVKGSWFQDDDGTVHVVDETVTLDLNIDSIDDVQLSHGFVLEPRFLHKHKKPNNPYATEAANYLQVGDYTVLHPSRRARGMPPLTVKRIDAVFATSHRGDEHSHERPVGDGFELLNDALLSDPWVS